MSKMLSPDEIENIWKKEENCCLCIGSGLTGAFVGEWSALLSKLAKNRLLNTWSRRFGGNDQLKDFFFQNPDFNPFPSINVLEQGEYLLADDGDDSLFIDTMHEDKWREIFFMEQVSAAIEGCVRSYIAEECSGKNKDKKPCIHASNCFKLTQRDALATMSVSEFENGLLDCPKCCGIRDRLSTLEAVLELCLSGKITQVICYNFDTILEQLLSDKSLQKRYTTKNVYVRSYTYGYFNDKKTINRGDCTYIYGEIPQNYINAKNDHSLEISIYHVHGTIGSDLPAVPLIFSEHSYIEYNDSFLNWSNQILLDVFTRYHTMCVGFSGTDSNFRTLTKSLKAADEHDLFGINRKYTITITRSETDYRDKYMKGIDKKYSDIVDGLTECTKNMVNRYYHSYFGVNVYWKYNFSQLAAFLKTHLTP